MSNGRRNGVNGSKDDEQKLIEALSNASEAATRTPDIEVRVTFDDLPKMKLGAIALATMLSRNNAIKYTYRTDNEAMLELKNGSCIRCMIAVVN